MRIDTIIAKIKASDKLTDEQKARLTRICELFQAAVLAIKKAVHGLREWARNHKSFVKVMLIALVLALIVGQVPIVGQTIAALCIVVGTAIAILRQFQSDFDSLLGLE